MLGKHHLLGVWIYQQIQYHQKCTKDCFGIRRLEFFQHIELSDFREADEGKQEDIFECSLEDELWQEEGWWSFESKLCVWQELSLRWGEQSESAWFFAHCFFQGTEADKDDRKHASLASASFAGEVQLQEDKQLWKFPNKTSEQGIQQQGKTLSLRNRRLRVVQTRLEEQKGEDSGADQPIVQHKPFSSLKSLQGSGDKAIGARSGQHCKDLRVDVCWLVDVIQKLEYTVDQTRRLKCSWEEQSGNRRTFSQSIDGKCQKQPHNEPFSLMFISSRFDKITIKILIRVCPKKYYK